MSKYVCGFCGANVDGEVVECCGGPFHANVCYEAHAAAEHENR